jgi:hypothetical protein
MPGICTLFSPLQDRTHVRKTARGALCPVPRDSSVQLRGAPGSSRPEGCGILRRLLVNHVDPVEAESYRILRSRLDLSALPPLSRAVTEHVIYATADFD